jgi:hypothetical protein
MSDNIVLERTITAFMEDPDAPRPENPIHSTDGGREYGYRAALIGGATVFGWTVPAILEVCGAQWLQQGWVDVSFRRPTYPGDEMTVRVLREQANNGAAYELEVDNEAGQHCLLATFGMGDAPWLNEIFTTAYETGQTPAPDLPALTMASAPVGEQLRSMSVMLFADDSSRFTASKQADENPIYHGEKAVAHPAYIASQLIHLLHHSFSYGPAIHTRSQIQNFAEVRSAQQLSITGYCHEVYERKGHHYIVNDGSIWSETGAELTRIRHTAIFKVAKRSDQVTMS